MGTSSQLPLIWLYALSLYVSPAYLVAECCHVYRGPPTQYPNWTIPNQTLWLHSCNNNREVVPELHGVMFNFPTFSSWHMKHSCLLYYTTIDECHSIVAIWFPGHEITPHLFQFSSGLGYLVVPLEYPWNSLTIALQCYTHHLHVVIFIDNWTATIAHLLTYAVAIKEISWPHFQAY